MLTRLCGGNRAEAEDIAQETFVAAYQGRTTFTGKGSQRAWILGIAVRRWRDRNRRKELATTPVSGQEDILDPAASNFESASLTRITLTRALQTLEERHKEALLLVVSQRLTYREAAEIMGEPIGTVKWRVHEASRLLRTHLIALEEEDNESNTTLEESPESASHQSHLPRRDARVGRGTAK